MKALVVVDMQNDFITGSLGTKEAENIIPKVEEKIRSYLDNGDFVFFTRDTHDDSYPKTQEGKNLPVPHCIKGTWGWEIADEIKNYVSNNFVINKPSFGSLKLMEMISCANLGFTSFEFVGLCTDICVISNALLVKACFSEIPVFVDASCCAGTTPEMHKEALDVMSSCQINVVGR